MAEAAALADNVFANVEIFNELIGYYLIRSTLVTLSWKWRLMLVIDLIIIGVCPIVGCL